MKNKHKIFCMYFEDDLYFLVKKYAKKRGLSIASYIRQAVNKFIDEQEK